MESNPAILKAHKQLNEMRESGGLCCIEISSDFNYTWDVSLVRTGGEHIHVRPLISFDTFSEAIEALYQVWRGTYEGEIRTYRVDIKYTELEDRHGV